MTKVQFTEQTEMWDYWSENPPSPKVNLSKFTRQELVQLKLKIEGVLNGSDMHDV